MTKAISPKQVALQKIKSFPDCVFEAFNELIASNFTQGSADVLQKDVIKLILAKANKGLDSENDITLTRADIFAKGYLNVEEVYRAQGWTVKYDKAAYNETYDSYFVFKEK